MGLQCRGGSIAARSTRQRAGRAAAWRLDGRCRGAEKMSPWGPSLCSRGKTRPRSPAKRLLACSLTRDALRFGRPGVECYCQHESGAAVIQLQFLINEVRTPSRGATAAADLGENGSEKKIIGQCASHFGRTDANYDCEITSWIWIE